MSAALPPVIIVAHGQPSDPAPAAAELAALAAKVEAHLPGQIVASATLAEPESLGRVVTKLGQGGLLYPLFMAGGWFTRTHLPARLQSVGAVGWQVLEPLGCDPALHELAVKVAAEALETRKGPILLAAHGSFKSPVPSDIARHVAAKIRSELGCDVRVGFIDQSPQLAEITDLGPDAICLPFFAAAGGHVTSDIPAALARSGFSGTLLPALGLRPEIPALIGQAIRAAHPVCAQECRFRQS
ncbi:sirohydrochlorin chelatase [Cypionkella sp.]|uniref:sirohydrochlorin chelatase n=1 Tax=Cypionkella sp. TaxID=2811411 RepID=UPI00262C5116|nr:CbiX/SirB N-terminal domain-containing protein [Cypionkella sp.]MDB5666339.1 hypothetical protein [Cypionkella sp.]